ncbi:MAG: C39 family peptidase [Nostocaceae cyanobacterium]|nr:C39 family peptidase [Nostocaceae cyanobacterium]
MYSDWAGAGGRWEVINETFTSEVVQQQDNLSCGAACGEMLLRDLGISITQADIAAEIGVPVTSRGLAAAMNTLAPSFSWAGGPLSIPNATISQLLYTLNSTGSWAAMLWESGSTIGHMVVVDGINETGYILIRDPWSGTKYQMRLDEFCQYWNEYAIYRR